METAISTVVSTIYRQSPETTKYRHCRTNMYCYTYVIQFYRLLLYDLIDSLYQRKIPKLFDKSTTLVLLIGS